MKWKDKLIRDLLVQLRRNLLWKSVIGSVEHVKTKSIHLAVVNQPYLSLILQGTKKVESRLSVNRISPHGRISRGDIVVVKEPGRPITGLFVAGSVTHVYNLDAKGLEEIRTKFGRSSCTYDDQEFWQKRRHARFATFVGITRTIKLNPILVEKRDRSAWSIVHAFNGRKRT